MGRGGSTSVTFIPPRSPRLRVRPVAFSYSTRKTFMTSSPRWLMTLTAMRPDFGFSNVQPAWESCWTSLPSMSLTALPFLHGVGPHPHALPHYRSALSTRAVRARLRASGTSPTPLALVTPAFFVARPSRYALVSHVLLGVHRRRPTRSDPRVSLWSHPSARYPIRLAGPSRAPSSSRKEPPISVR